MLASAVVSIMMLTSRWLRNNVVGGHHAALSASALVEKVHEPSLLTYRFSSSFSCKPKNVICDPSRQSTQKGLRFAGGVGVRSQGVCGCGSTF